MEEEEEEKSRRRKEEGKGERVNNKRECVRRHLLIELYTDAVTKYRTNGICVSFGKDNLKRL